MKRNSLCAATLAMTIAASAGAQTAPTGQESVAELVNIVRDLQQQVDELKAQANNDWLTEQRAEEIKGLVQDVLADADTRATLLQSGAVSGYDKGFFIASADGNFKLVVGGQFQFRFVYNNQDEGVVSGAPVDEHRYGFEIRRAKFWFKGNVIDPSWTYDFQFAADRGTGSVALEDAGWIQKDFGNGWKVRVGQQKAPFMREEIVSSTRLLLIERSLMNSAFTAGTVQGVQVGWEGDSIHAYGMVHDGDKTANTAWQAEDTEFAASARVEWLANGEWKNFNDYNSFKDEGSGLLVGAAINWNKQEYGSTLVVGPPVSGNNTEIEALGLTADVTWDLGGASLAGAVVYRQQDIDATGVTMDQYGLMLRGGVFITDEWELYGQYEWADLDTSGVEDLSVVTLGATKYWAKHGLKWQSDIGYAFNNIHSSLAQTSAGWRTDAAGNDGQIVIRSQIQLLF